MKKEKATPWADYYDQADILDELLEEPAEFSLGEQLRRDVLSKKRKRKLQNVTIKIDPLQIKAIRKLATTKSIPYQTLIRHWLSEEIRKEMKGGGASGLHASQVARMKSFRVTGGRN